MREPTDPWNTNRGLPDAYSDAGYGDDGFGAPNSTRPADNSIPDPVWVSCLLLDDKVGNWADKHHLYHIQSVGIDVIRRYSDFAWLNAYLLKNRTFRLIPPLPPKRLAVHGTHFADAGFLSRRARGLARYSSALLSHPGFSTDPVVQDFFAKPELDRQDTLTKAHAEECWRILTPMEQAAVPADLEERLNALKPSIIDLAATWTRVSLALERSINRSLVESNDLARLCEAFDQASDQLRSAFPDSSHTLLFHLTACGKTCRACSKHIQDAAVKQNLELLERLKSHRELFSSFRDLLVRHQTASRDSVDKLRSKVENASKRMDKVRTDQKPGWQAECDKLSGFIAADNQSIDALLQRRLFIRYALSQELDYLSQAILNLSDVLRNGSEHAQLAASVASEAWGTLSNALS